MKITIDGADKTLQTENKYCSENIVVGINDLIKKGAQTYTPSTSNQTIDANQFLTGAQTILGDANLIAANIASGKTIFGITGTHSGGITPTGTINITENGTIDVTQYANANVNVESGIPLPDSITAGNTPVLVSAQTADIGTSSYRSTDVSITIKKSGTYRFKWCMNGNRNAMGSSYKGYSKLYVNNIARGSEKTQSGTELGSFSEDLSVNSGDVVTLYGKSDSTTYSAKVGFLTACINWDNSF